MGFITGFIRFVVGTILGAATGATVATLIVTRNGEETVERLRGMVDDMLQSGKNAAQEEEARMLQRRQELIGEAGVQRQEKTLEQKAVQIAKKEIKKEAKKK